MNTRQDTASGQLDRWANPMRGFGATLVLSRAGRSCRMAPPAHAASFGSLDQAPELTTKNPSPERADASLVLCHLLSPARRQRASSTTDDGPDGNHPEGGARGTERQASRAEGPIQQLRLHTSARPWPLPTKTK